MKVQIVHDGENGSVLREIGLNRFHADHAGDMEAMGRWR
jgi:hypothetical protein